MQADKPRPSYVRFERVAVEDKVESRKQGRYVARDVDMVFVTSPGSKDVFKAEVATWFERQQANVHADRIPQEWLDSYKASYERWRNGQEVPLHGVPIKGWGMISPAQQEMLVRVNILTVEDLSKVSEEGMRRIGMGANELKNKAKAWLDQLNDKGAVSQEVAELKKENELLKQNNTSMQEQLDSMGKQIEALMSDKPVVTVDVGENVPIGELNNSEVESLKQQYQALYGKPAHHLMKVETIKRRIEEKQ